VPDTVPAAETVRQCFAFDPKERPTASALADAFRPPEDDAAGANPAELQRQHLQHDALRRENAALAAENAAQLAAHAAELAAQQAELAAVRLQLAASEARFAEQAAHRQAAEAAASRLGESEALVAELTGEIAAQQAESAAQRAAHAAQIAQMEALLAQLQRELGRRYVRRGGDGPTGKNKNSGGRCRLGSCVLRAVRARVRGYARLLVLGLRAHACACGSDAYPIGCVWVLRICGGFRY
jgi:hypothetical protein